MRGLLDFVLPRPRSRHRSWFRGRDDDLFDRLFRHTGLDPVSSHTFHKRWIAALLLRALAIVCLRCALFVMARCLEGDCTDWSDRPNQCAVWPIVSQLGFYPSSLRGGSRWLRIYFAGSIRIAPPAPKRRVRFDPLGLRPCSVCDRVEHKKEARNIKNRRRCPRRFLSCIRLLNLSINEAAAGYPDLPGLPGTEQMLQLTGGSKEQLSWQLPRSDQPVSGSQHQFPKRRPVSW